ncbi:MAG: hydrolase TatD [Candidatus Parcubacteria bacterium]|nr:MAG: hydrolase TatD [Candidatus Parcubacteria bacterium]
MIDCHCHLDSEIFNNDLDLVIARAKKVGVKYIIAPAVDYQSFAKILKIAQKYKFVLPLLGYHPHNIYNLSFSEFEVFFKNLLENNKNNIIGIGEVGLDYFYDKSIKKKQLQFLELQLHNAEVYKLPVQLHIRESFRDCFDLVKKYNILPIWHSFNGSYLEAKKFLDRNGYISLSGMITFQKLNKLIEIIKKIPVEKILLETDSPFLTPEPLRGRRNEPSYVKIIYEFVTEILNLDSNYLQQQINNNFLEIFKNQLNKTKK